MTVKKTSQVQSLTEATYTFTRHLSDQIDFCVLHLSRLIFYAVLGTGEFLGYCLFFKAVE